MEKRKKEEENEEIAYVALHLYVVLVALDAVWDPAAGLQVVGFFLAQGRAEVDALVQSRGCGCGSGSGWLDVDGARVGREADGETEEEE
jgi:hypothetical protein